MTLGRDRLLLRGVALTLTAFVVFVVLPKALSALGTPLYATTAGRWAGLALIIAAAVAQAFALLALNRSRQGWKDTKAMVALALMIVGGLLLFLYVAVALMAFASALSPGNGLFR